MHLFYDVIVKLNSMYYDKTKIDAGKMVTGAISGMVASLGDPYTSFFPPKQNTDFKTQLAGEFSGIGAELSLNDQNQIIVMAPLDGSPAEKAGVKSGDLIVKVDGKMTSGWTLAQAVEVIRGHKGTKVTITVLHPKEKEAHDLTIVRDTIQVKSVTSWVKQFDCSKGTCVQSSNCSPTAGGCITVAYIRISQFGDKTNSEWLAAVNKIMPQIKAAKNFKGIILDVRNNPGGYLNDAVYIASEFIKSGPIVKQQDGNGKIESMDVNRTGVLLTEPLLVLINKGSASASEIVSGALQDYGRAKLVGEQSFGKGTIQQAVDLDGGGSVHISIGKWLTPKERWVHEKGLTPDIAVVFDASASAKMTDKMDNQIFRAIKELSK
jgi:carboxyl-terminal processing protease